MPMGESLLDAARRGYEISGVSVCLAANDIPISGNVTGCAVHLSVDYNFHLSPTPATRAALSPNPNSANSAK